MSWEVISRARTVLGLESSAEGACDFITELGLSLAAPAELSLSVRAGPASNPLNRHQPTRTKIAARIARLGVQSRRGRRGRQFSGRSAELGRRGGENGLLIPGAPIRRRHRRDEILGLAGQDHFIPKISTKITWCVSNGTLLRLAGTCSLSRNGSWNLIPRKAGLRRPATHCRFPDPGSPPGIVQTDLRSSRRALRRNV